MIYKSTDGTSREGIVWSPGPLHNTVWVLPYSGASSALAVVVKVDTKTGTVTEVERPLPPCHQYHSQWGMVRTRPAEPLEAQAHYLSTYKHAPRLVKAWAMALAMDVPTAEALAA